MQEYNNVLIITSAGGSGHIQAAKAKKQEMNRKYPQANIYVKDMLLEFGIGLVSSLGVKLFNSFHRSANVGCLEKLVSLNSLADKFFGPVFFIRVLKFLLINDIDKIIDTQPVGNGYIIKAIRIYNKITKKALVLEKVLVDLPTSKNQHFFSNLKKISSKDRNYIKVFTLEPLLQESETDEIFWEKHCNLKTKHIVYVRSLLRESFKQYENKNRLKESINISISSKHIYEEDLLLQTCIKCKANFEKKDSVFSFNIKPEDKLITVMLGSQPAFRSTIHYAKNIIKMISQLNDLSQNCYLFIFCGDEFSKKSLFHVISQLILRLPNFPHNLKVIPMSFQNEETIAPLLFRSDVTITRSGGITTMELLGVAKGKVFIHSETTSIDPSFEEKLKGIPIWEGGNACYLINKIQADLITPYLTEDYLLSSLVGS